MKHIVNETMYDQEEVKRKFSHKLISSRKCYVQRVKMLESLEEVKDSEEISPGVKIYRLGKGRIMSNEEEGSFGFTSDVDSIIKRKLERRI